MKATAILCLGLLSVFSGCSDNGGDDGNGEYSYTVVSGGFSDGEGVDDVLALGDIAYGGKKSVTLVFRNDGMATINFQDINMSGDAGFSLGTLPPMDVPAQSSREVTLTCDPSTTGALETLLTYAVMEVPGVTNGFRVTANALAFVGQALAPPAWIIGIWRNGDIVWTFTSDNCVYAPTGAYAGTGFDAKAVNNDPEANLTYGGSILTGPDKYLLGATPREGSGSITYEFASNTAATIHYTLSLSTVLLTKD